MPQSSILTFLSALSDHIDERTVCNAVSPTKDVDGFHVVNVGRMCLDQSTMLPATPWGVWEIIKRTGNRRDLLPTFEVYIYIFCLRRLNVDSCLLGIPTLGKNVVVAGRSKNVGMPIAMLLHTDGRHERPGGWLKDMLAERSRFQISSVCYTTAYLFCCRRCHGHHFSPLHSKRATTPTH